MASLTTSTLIHEVNSINWNHSGQFLLSGSDDRHICICDFYNASCDEHFLVDSPVFRRKLRPESNIFTTKFLPFTNDSQIITGFKCGCLVCSDVNRSDTLIFSHKSAIYNILTLEDLPHCLISLSHDKTVNFYDTRLPCSLGSNTKLCSRKCYSSIVAHSTNSLCSVPLVTKPLNFSFPVCAGDVHPSKQSTCIAIASSDGFVRLYDFRCLFRSSSNPTASETDKPVSFAVSRPLGLTDDARSFNTFDYGPLHITDVQFEPLHHSLQINEKKSSWIKGLNYPTYCTNYSPFYCYPDGHTMLVNHMYSPIFLFDLTKAESSLDKLPNDPDPHGWFLQRYIKDNPDESSTESFEDDSVQAQPVNEAFNATSLGSINSTRRFVLAALINYMHFQSTRMTNNGVSNSNNTQSAASDRTHTGSNNRSSSSNSDVEDVTSESNNRTLRASSSRPPNLNSFLYPLSPQYVQDIFEETKIRLKQIRGFRGRKSQRTVIKSACFWGRNYIISGSECGHLFIWERSTGNPVVAIPADSSVVNRISPHPFKPFLAVSGIDHSIKVLQPEVYFTDENSEDIEDTRAVRVHPQYAEHQRIMKLCQRNQESDHSCLTMGPNLIRQFVQLRNEEVRVLRSLARLHIQNNTVESNDLIENTSAEEELVASSAPQSDENEE